MINKNKNDRPSSTGGELTEFMAALNGGKGELDAWLECNNEIECRAIIRAALATPVAAIPANVAGDFSDADRTTLAFMGIGTQAAIPAAGSGAVPDGWKLVPVEPTPEMLDVAGAALAKNGAEGNVIELQGDAHKAYAAMLAATPAATVIA